MPEEQNGTEPLPPQVPETNRLDRKRIFAISLVAVFLIAAGCIYFFNKSQNKTTKENVTNQPKLTTDGWKPYDKLGVSFKVPQDWTIAESDDTNEVDFESAARNERTKGYDFSSEMVLTRGSRYDGIAQPIEFPINGRTFKEFNGWFGKSVIFETTQDDIVYHFEFPLEEQEVGKEIISDLKISPRKTDWKVYNNACFNFDYPGYYSLKDEVCEQAKFSEANFENYLHYFYTLSVSRNKTKQSSKEFLKDSADFFGNNNYEVSKISLDGREALKVLKPWSSSSKNTTIAVKFVEEGYEYTLSLFSQVPRNIVGDRIVSDFDRTISSFKIPN